MTRRLLIATVALVLLLCSGAVRAAVPPGNVLVNAGAEDGAGSADGSTVPVPGWVTENGFTVVAYGAPGFPPPVPGLGANFFAGGPAGGVARASQTVDLAASAPEIDARRVDAVLSGRLVGRPGARVGLEFFDQSGRSLSRGGVSSTVTGPETFPGQRARLAVPKQARLARVTMTATDNDGGYNDIFFDDLSLRLVLRTAARPERAHTVVVTPTKGTVRVAERRGHGRIIAGPTVVPVGSSVDTTRGAVRVESAVDADGAETNQGSFSQGVFAISQISTRPTVLSLGGTGSRECSRPRRLASRTEDDFVVLAGKTATMAVDGPAAWVTLDRCTKTDVKVRAGDIDCADTGSRNSSAATVRGRRLFRTSAKRRIRTLFGRACGRFRTRGRNGSATVRGKIAVVDPRRVPARSRPVRVQDTSPR